MTAQRAWARAHVNIALSKYWGKADADLNLPAVPSLSASIEALWTEVDIRFEAGRRDDLLTIDDAPALPAELARMTSFLDLARHRAGTNAGAVVTTRSTFPRAAGLASSASAFAALAMAATSALELDPSPRVLSALARRGSGSAARSVFGGYVEIELPSDGEALPDTLAAAPVVPAGHLPLDVAIVLANSETKSVSSRAAMTRCAETSPYYRAWVELCRSDFAAIKRALLERDFEALAHATERNCLRMHAATMGNDPPILYWNETTIAAIHTVGALRRRGHRAFYTIDAGPNVVIFLDPADRGAVGDALDALDAPVRYTRVGGEPCSHKGAWAPADPPEGHQA